MQYACIVFLKGRRHCNRSALSCSLKLIVQLNGTISWKLADRIAFEVGGMSKARGGG